ncbi:fluoride efflux transporter FluC [Nocardioides sp.]|uniref:fluoride efflux transporter FluC n=1 Tax=Nocardioides sp. TaxID=35761 RepID=UPI002CC8DF43|nr:CrcB family protein [Nocardioides sp.]HXH77346.1 CrcB family protein [Nocardioides sp.]
MTRPAGAQPVGDPAAGTRPLLPLLLVALGAAVGALLRWGLGRHDSPGPEVPWVTLAINAGGCFALAALPAIGAVRRSPHLSVLLGPGLLGGFTTVSTWAEESRGLASEGAPGTAAFYVGLTLASCLTAAVAGRLFARSIVGPLA